MCSCEDFPASFYQETTRIARKDHACFECDRGIQKGDRYVTCFGIWDGRPDSFKRCDNCATVAWLAHALIDDFCAPFGELNECVEEALRQ